MISRDFSVASVFLLLVVSPKGGLMGRARHDHVIDVSALLLECAHSVLCVYTYRNRCCARS